MKKPLILLGRNLNAPVRVRVRGALILLGRNLNAKLLGAFVLALAVVFGVGCGGIAQPTTQPTTQPVDPNAAFLAKVAKVRTFIETAFPPGPKRDAWLARLDLVTTADALAVLAVELGVDLAK